MEAEFIHQDLIDGPWSQYLWEKPNWTTWSAEGDKEHERAIALAVAELRARAHKCAGDDRPRERSREHSVQPTVRPP